MKHDFKYRSSDGLLCVINYVCTKCGVKVYNEEDFETSECTDVKKEKLPSRIKINEEFDLVIEPNDEGN